MKIRLVALVAAAATLIAVAFTPPSGAQSAPGPRAGVTIPLPRVGDLSGVDATLNPNETQGCATDVCGLGMERLMEFNPNGRTVHPELAASVGQPNKVTYIYHLRRGVRFWDGDELTSADVVTSLDYQRAPASETAIYYVNVKSIKATNKYTVVIVLKHPDAAWKYTLAFEGVIIEKKFIDADPTTLGRPGVLLMGTGPWEIDSYDPTSGAVLTANPHWWGGKVPIKKITFTWFASETSEALAMRAGDIDIAFPSGGQAFASTAGAAARLIATPSLAQDWLAMNAKIRPWNDVHVRRAVAYAVERANLITANGGAQSGVPLYTIIPPLELRTLGSQSQVTRLLKSLPQYTYNLSKAKQQMSESAYPKGFSVSIDTTDCCGFPDVLQVIASQLQRIGIELNISEVTVGKFIDILYGPHDYGLTFSDLYAAYPDPSEQAGYLLGSVAAKPGGINAADYAPKSVDELLARGLAATKPIARLAIYGDLLNKVATDLPYVPLFNFDAYTVISNKLAMAPLDILNYQLPWALLVKPSH